MLLYDSVSIRCGPCLISMSRLALKTTSSSGSYPFVLFVIFLFVTHFFRHELVAIITDPLGEGLLPYTSYMGVCRFEGYGFQAV